MTNERFIKKRYVRVEDRHVHYRTAGSGPPLVLMHDSPRTSILLIPLIEWLRDRFTVFALDSPGFGLSDPLPKDPLVIADIADSVAKTMKSLGIARCSVYGTHTSSKIAIELAMRHSNLVTGIILDGVSVISQNDAEFMKGYFRTYKVEDDGAFLAQCWTKEIDQFRHFPWHIRTTKTRLDLDFHDANALQAHLMDLFYAGPGYHIAYSAAFRHRPAPLMKKLHVSTNIICRIDDVLFSQLDNLPKLPDCCSVERLPADDLVWKTRIKEIFESHRDEAAWSGERQRTSESIFARGLKRSYLDFTHGQMAVRKEGPSDERPLLVLHDVPGAHSHMMPLVHAFGRERYTLCLDLPGTGESDPLPHDKPTVANYASAISQALDALDIDNIDLYAPGTGVAFAIELAVSAPEKVGKVILDGGFLLSERQSAELISRYCPSLEPEWDGSHLNCCWHMLRNAEMSWPWYDPSRTAIRWRDQTEDPEIRQARLFDIFKQHNIYSQACHAVFSYPVAERLALLGVPCLLFTVGRDPLYAWAKDAAALAPNIRTKERPTTLDALTSLALDFLKR